MEIGEVARKYIWTFGLTEQNPIPAVAPSVPESIFMCSVSPGHKCFSS